MSRVVPRPSYWTPGYRPYPRATCRGSGSLSLMSSISSASLCQIRNLEKKPEDIEPAFFFSPIWAARGKFLYFLVGNFFYHSLFFLSKTLNFFYKIYILILVCQNSRHENQFIFRETRSESHHRRHWRSDLECIKFLHTCRLMIKLTVGAKSWKFVFNKFIFCWSFNRQKLCAQEITNHLKWKLLNRTIFTMLGNWDHLKMRFDKTYNALWTKLP